MSAKVKYQRGSGIPDPIDVDAGAQLKKLRTIKGYSQERLADDLGITFQQIQKYERGKNRISASRLYRISVIFDVQVQYFFPKQNKGGAISGLDIVIDTLKKRLECYEELIQNLQTDFKNVKKGTRSDAGERVQDSAANRG